MTTTESIQSMARRLSKAIKDGGAPAADAILGEIVRLHGRDVARSALDEMGRQNDFEWEEAKTERAKQLRFEGNITRLFKACPEAKTTEEVCRIIAARGDTFAQEIHVWLESFEYRVGTTLAEAAAELRLGWRRNDDANIQKLDNSAPSRLPWSSGCTARAREIERREGAP